MIYREKIKIINPWGEDLETPPAQSLNDAPVVQ